MDPIEEAYRTHHQRLWKSLYAFCGDADVATEAAAETYSQALRRGAELVDPGAWIWRTAFRVAGGLLTDRKRRATPSGIDLDRPSAVNDPELVGLDLIEFLDQLRSLSDQQRAAVVLRYAGGFTPAEIAELLDTSANSIRVQLHRAHTHLRDQARNDAQNGWPT